MIKAEVALMISDNFLEVMHGRLVAAGVAAKQGVGSCAAGRKALATQGEPDGLVLLELAMEQARRGVHASIQYRAWENGAPLIYQSPLGQGEEWWDAGLPGSPGADFPVITAAPACGFAALPANRRVAVIYGGKGVCLSPLSPLAYDCQHETPDDRVAVKSTSCGIGWKRGTGLLNGKQWKPKWMLAKAYHRLETEYDERMRRLLVLMRGRFGL